MNTDKRNQHYLPKFYLRHFSYQNNKKQIGIYNINNKLFFPNAALKHQASENFFYGHDGVIENALADLETSLGKVIKEIATLNFPKKDSDEYFRLLRFAVLTHLRNPVAIKSAKESNERKRIEALKLMQQKDVDKVIPSLENKSAIALSLMQLGKIEKIVIDLEYKLLINETKTPFISSDSPIIRYNQYLEKRGHYRGTTGFGNLGLQIFIPINPKITIVFYDATVYKVGVKRSKILKLANVGDIEQLNLLQILSCSSTIYFNESISKHYVAQLIEKSKRYQKSHSITSRGFANYIMINHGTSKIRLNIQGIKELSCAKLRNLDKSKLHIRPLASKIMN